MLFQGRFKAVLHDFSGVVGRTLLVGPTALP